MPEQTASALPGQAEPLTRIPISRQRGAWIRLTPNEQAILRAALRFTQGHAKPDSAIQFYAPVLLERLGELPS